jgi:hypothetical protein
MRSVRSRLCAVSLTAIAALAPATAQAATDTTSIAITGGTLEYTTPFAAGDFPATTLTGAQQTKSANVEAFVVTDSRGGSAGWHLTIAASQFTASGGDTLPTGSLTMAVPPVPTTTLGNLGIAPVPNATLAATPIDGGSTQNIASAAALALSGAGKWTFTPLTGALSLTVPPAVAPGTYTSTITTTLATGP